MDLKVILRATVGSTIHGTSVKEQDDRDEMAIAVEPREYVLGLRHWETTVERTKPEGVKSGPGDLDLVIHSLRKYCRLAARGNPTILLPLFSPIENLIESTEYGLRLIKQRDMFLSQECGRAFLGYMTAQKNRLEESQGGRHGTRPELVEQYGFDTKYAGHIIRLGYQGMELLTTGRLSLPMRESERQDVVDIRTGKWTLQRVLTRAGELEAGLRDSIDTGVLPPNPDEKAINEYLVDTYQEVWNKQAA